MRKRTQARECALKILYQAEITHRDMIAALDNFWSQKQDIDKAIKDFSEFVVKGVGDHVDDIDERIGKYATNWQLKRMAVIDRNILRIGVFELVFSPDTPPKVTINEAVELAKKYGDLESSKFVNGVLDKIHKTEIMPKQETHG